MKKMKINVNDVFDEDSEFWHQVQSVKGYKKFEKDLEHTGGQRTKTPKKFSEFDDSEFSRDRPRKTPKKPKHK